MASTLLALKNRIYNNIIVIIYHIWHCCACSALLLLLLLDIISNDQLESFGKGAQDGEEEEEELTICEGGRERRERFSAIRKFFTR